LKNIQIYLELMEQGRYREAKRALDRAWYRNLFSISAKNTAAGRWMKEHWEEIVDDLARRIHPAYGKEILELAAWNSHTRYERSPYTTYKRYFKDGSHAPESPAPILALLRGTHNELVRKIRDKEARARRQTVQFPRYRLRKSPARRQSRR